MNRENTIATQAPSQNAAGTSEKPESKKQLQTKDKKNYYNANYRNRKYPKKIPFYFPKQNNNYEKEIADKYGLIINENEYNDNEMVYPITPPVPEAEIKPSKIKIKFNYSNIDLNETMNNNNNNNNNNNEPISSNNEKITKQLFGDIPLLGGTQREAVPQQLRAPAINNPITRWIQN